MFITVNINVMNRVTRREEETVMKHKGGGSVLAECRRVGSMGILFAASPSPLIRNVITKIHTFRSNVTLFLFFLYVGPCIVNRT